jgi:ppGpp synthetase/RelA/SpoT-type nucleotidyltranferase
VLWNKRWPQQPDGGWVTPENCYSRLDDLVRTTIVCTFLDGPEVISTALKKFCESHKVPVSIRKLNRNEGYYAHHAYLAFPMELARLAGGVSAQDVRLEIQVSTQAQHLLKQLTHHYYKKERSQPRKNRDEWQWEFRTNRFRARYLSHALHLLEGLIVDVRDRPDHDDDDKQE